MESSQASEWACDQLQGWLATPLTHWETSRWFTDLKSPNKACLHKSLTREEALTYQTLRGLTATWPKDKTGWLGVVPGRGLTLAREDQGLQWTWIQTIQVPGSDLSAKGILMLITQRRVTRRYKVAILLPFREKVGDATQIMGDLGG